MTSQKHRESLAESVINETVEKLKGIFAGWRAAFKTREGFDNYRKEFFKALVEFRITSKEQIEFGVRRARTEAKNGREFMPSGAQFAGWCQPLAEDLGIEPFALVAKCICTGQWEKIHPAFQHVSRDFDLYQIRRMSQDKAAKPLKEIYAAVVRRVGAGEQFDRIVSISDLNVYSGSRPASKATAQAAMAEMMKGLRA